MTCTRTHNQFVKELKNKNEKILDYIEYFITRYTKSSKKIYVKTKYGICRISPITVMRMKKISIDSAIDKTNYYMKKLQHMQPDTFNKIIKVLSKYENNKTKLRVMTKHGVCLIRPDSTLHSGGITIRSAENRVEYFKSQSIEIHGDKYSYNKVSFNIITDSVTVTCKKHGDFNQVASCHLWGDGCRKCFIESSNGWMGTEAMDKNKDKWTRTSCRLYLIKFINLYESFYKIGITTSNVETRFRRGNMGDTDYFIQYFEYIESNLYDCKKIESNLHKLNHSDKYVPNEKFSGWTECFSSIDLISKELKNLGFPLDEKIVISGDENLVNEMKVQTVAHNYQLEI